MRVLQFGGLAGPGPVAGGVWRVAETHARILRDRGHQVELFGLWLGEPEQADGVHRLRARPPFPGAGYRGLLARDLAGRLAAHGPYDVAHIHLARDYASNAAMRWAHAQGIPTVVQTHGMVTTAAKPSTKAFDVLFKPTMVRYPDLWLSLTDLETRQLHEFGARRVVQVANPVLPSGHTWQPDPNRFLLFASRLHERKQASVLVEALALARKQCPDMRLVIAGPDEGDLANLRATIERTATADAVDIVGPQDQTSVRDLLSRCSGMVLASRGEVAPMIAIESCEIGAPMVLTTDCGLAAGLQAADAGEIRTPNADSFAEAMEGLWTSPERAQHLSQAAHRYYVDHWSPQQVVGQLEAAYASATTTRVRN